jgi:hypothetical protein
MLSHNFKLNFESSDEEEDNVIRKKFELKYNDNDEDEDEDEEEDDENILKKPNDSKNSKLIKPNFFDSDDEDEINQKLKSKDKISKQVDSNNSSNYFFLQFILCTN